MANEYFVGQQPTVWVEFLVDGVATDPTTITLTVIKPDYTEEVYTYALGEVDKDGTGQFSKAIVADMIGTWLYRWEGTGTCIASYENYFRAITYLG